MSSSRSPVSIILALTLISLLAPVNTRTYQRPDHKGPAYRHTYYAEDKMSKNNRDSLNQLSKSDAVQTDRNNEAQNIQDGYRRNYIHVKYYVGPEAFEAPTLNKDPEEYAVKHGSEFNDISTDELKTKKPPVNISVDRIINTPRRKCPAGQKMDTFGTCKAVWES